MISKMKIAPLLLCLLPGLSLGADIELKGKFTSKVSAHVIKENNLFVTDEKGTWYDQGLQLEQLGAFDAPYSVAAPLRITSSSGTFQASLALPLTLQNKNKPELLFRNIKVVMGAMDSPVQELTATTKVTFSNPPPINGEDTIGHYLINISGYPPAGDFKSVGGTYSGVLSLLFEPVVE